MTVDIARMKMRLEEKRKSLQSDIASQDQAYPKPVDPIELDEGPRDFGDIAVDFLETQQEQSILVNLQALLTEVEDALRRIDEGTYGFCVVCGQPIPEERLEAIPWAALCVKDAARVEQRNLSREELYDSDIY